MNRKEAAELSPFIKAFGEGRIIEFSSITDVSKAWREVTDFPIGMIKNFKFRIKPEPKFRPFKDAEECWNEMQKHYPIGWTKLKGEIEYSFITDINDNINYSDAIRDYTFVDGAPFGAKVEE
nr:MAG: hypothetical protein [Bacteriophage sp.]